MEQLPSFNQLAHELGRLPGIGPKTAQRLAYHLLRASDERIEALKKSLTAVKELIRECPQCHSFTEELDLCKLCSDPHRHQESICIVEDPADISRIEGSGVFRGQYHVLHGALNPLEGVGPEDLKISSLFDRLANNPGIKEVILALDADLEGDTTVLYLAKILREKGLKTTRIAHGVPIGGDIDYIDNRTLGRALENRVQL